MTETNNLEGLDEFCIEFLSQQKHSTSLTYKCFLKLVLEFTGMTGKQIIESKRADKDNEWEQKTLQFKQWMKEKGNSDNTIKSAITALKSFFNYYRTPLTFNQSEKRKLNGRAQRVTQDYPLTNEDIGKMAFGGNLREKYIVLLGKSFGLRASDFTPLTFGAFRAIDLNQEPPILLNENGIQTKKEGTNAYPFIDADALPIVKQILDINRDKPDDKRIITVQEEELSSIIQNLAKRANINLGNKHLRFHCFRKYLITRLSADTSDSKWKQIVGKAISEDAYVSPLELREIYFKAMKYTTINTNGNGKVTKISEELKELSYRINSQTKIIDALVQDSTKKDLELEKIKSELKALKNVIKAIAESDIYKEKTEGIHEELAEKITADSEFMEKHKEDFEKIKSGEFNPDKK
jgi:integrase